MARITDALSLRMVSPPSTTVPLCLSVLSPTTPVNVNSSPDAAGLISPNAYLTDPASALRSISMVRGANQMPATAISISPLISPAAAYNSMLFCSPKSTPPVPVSQTPHFHSALELDTSMLPHAAADLLALNHDAAVSAAISSLARSLPPDDPLPLPRPEHPPFSALISPVQPCATATVPSPAKAASISTTTAAAGQTQLESDIISNIVRELHDSQQAVQTVPSSSTLQQASASSSPDPCATNGKLEIVIAEDDTRGGAVVVAAKRRGRPPKAESPGPKPFRCPHCNRGFRQQTTMRQHERVHTDERPYKCRYCTKCFKQLSHRHQHERIHTGEKPYACPICMKMFRQQNHLNSHYKSHCNALGPIPHRLTSEAVEAELAALQEPETEQNMEADSTTGDEDLIGKKQD